MAMGVTADTASVAADDDYVVAEFRTELAELLKNEKSRINFLTMMAHDSAADGRHADGIAAAIDEHIRKVPTDRKLLTLFLIDSIVKNDAANATAARAYRERFARIIIPLFVHIFKESDERARATLHKVRKSWTEEHFPRNRLYGIDIKVKELDPAWPVMSIERASANVHVNPRFINDEARQLADLERKKREMEALAKAAADAANVDVMHVKTEVITLADGASTSRPRKGPRKEMTARFTNEATVALPAAALEQPISPPSDPRKRRDKKKGGKKRKSSTSAAAIDVDVDMRKSSTDATNGATKRPKTVSPTARPPPQLTETTSLLSRDAPVTPLVPHTVGHTAQPLAHNNHASHALSTVPANNRIYLDGKPYEVKYIGELPIVERDGLPHKVYFHGAPRQVFIDGRPYMLAFNETLTVMIDGTQLTIRFGAPSRELYIGRHPFRGAFGGPPIWATINGVRHEIRISGPPPEVKIEPEPSHELSRYVQQPSMVVAPQALMAARTMGILPAPMTTMAPAFMPQQLPVVQQPPSLFDTLVAGDLLRAIEETKMKTAAMRATTRPPVAREPTPPIPSGHTYIDDTDVQKEYAAPANIKQFSIRTLKVRYQAVVESLYPSTQRCMNCGLRFSSHDGAAYRRHLDWHYRETSKAEAQRVTGANCARRWYLALDDWQLYTADKTDGELAEGRVAAFDTAPAASVAAHVPVADAPDGSDVSNCWVCNEEFEQFYDDDGDQWKLRNCITVGNKFYHPGCHTTDDDPTLDTTAGDDDAAAKIDGITS